MELYTEETDGATAERITLLDSLGHEWLKLPHLAMQTVGPATQSLAGLLKVTKKSTFTEQRTIARAARVDFRKFQRHLRKLHEHAWVVNAGRQHTRAGRPRRTATLKIPQHTRDNQRPYGFLPWWACCRIRRLHGRKGGRLPWSAKAVLSIVMARLLSLKAAAERDGEEVLEPGDIEGVMGDLTDRFRFTLDSLQETTGLDRHSVIAAKRFLHSRDIVDWSGSAYCNVADSLTPNWDFRVVVMPAPKGGVFIDFSKG